MLGSFLRYSLGYESSFVEKLSIAFPLILVLCVLLCLAFAKGPIRILLYIFGSLLVVGGVKTIVHQYLMHASGAHAIILIEYLVGATLLIFGLCVVVPVYKLVKVNEISSSS